jgi:DNA-binding protein
MTKYTKQRLLEMMNRVSGMPLTEVDWEGEFSDVSKECLNVEELKIYLNNVISNYNLPGSKRTKPSLLIHNKAIPFDEKGDIDVDTFIENITQMPIQIYSQNAKMEKSGSENSATYNIGIPALRGLVYDIENKKFYIVNTCPGAGICTRVCYARRGRYVIQPNIFVKQTRILNLLLNYPDKFEKLLKHEIEVLAIRNDNKKVIFRWNDAGDFFTKRYFEIAVNITKELKNEGYNFESYAHTKMGEIYNLSDPNITLSFSTDANEKEKNKVNITKAKTSEIVPSALFADLFVRDRAHFAVDEKGKLIPKNNDSIDTLKQRISDKYGVDINTLLTYNEMLKTPERNERNINVIVMPKGEGDISAQRKDVARTFLLYH